EFLRGVTALALGDLVPADRVAPCQTPGGTGALKVAADFIATHAPQARVWCSAPTWPNHIGVFESAGLVTTTYPYLAGDRRSLDFDAWLAALERDGRAGDVICLHACCHN